MTLSPSPRKIWLLGASLMCLLGILSLELAVTYKKTHPTPQRDAVQFNETYIQHLAQHTLDLKKPRSVFSYVFRQLPNIVHVYPTENYYYFHFFSGGYEVSGNFRFDREDRDKGLLDVGYFATMNQPEKEEDMDVLSTYHQFTQKEGVTLTKDGPLAYRVTFQGKTVHFLLHDVPQTTPDASQLPEGATFLYRTFDESGFQFLLASRENPAGFSFVLDPIAPLPDILEEKDPHVFVGRRTGFAFYEFPGGQKVLIGVDAHNIRRNNWYDGPFDQLADNFVNDDLLKNHIEKAYPYAKGRLSRFGGFVDSEGHTLNSRMAITPYIAYESLSDLRIFVHSCQKQTQTPALLACLTYDYRQDVPTAP